MPWCVGPRSTPQKRCVEPVRTLFFGDDLESPLLLGQLNALGLPYETYKLALTHDLLETILGEKLQELPLEEGEIDRDRVLGRILQEGGYHQFADETDRDKWWIRSGIAGFGDNPAEHFYLPNRYTDPFGNTTELTYDSNYHLYIQSSKDPVENVTEIDAFDFRVLAPSQMRDINDNLSGVAFDILGLPAAMALKGKGSQGDNLENVFTDPDTGTLIQFFTGDYDNEGEAEARALLGYATARHVYYFGEQFIEESEVGQRTGEPKGRVCKQAVRSSRHHAHHDAKRQAPDWRPTEPIVNLGRGELEEAGGSCKLVRTE